MFLMRHIIVKKFKKFLILIKNSNDNWYYYWLVNANNIQSFQNKTHIWYTVPSLSHTPHIGNFEEKCEHVYKVTNV